MNVFPMKKTAKKFEASKKTYSADHVSVMLEGIYDAMLAFGEGQEVLSNKVDVLSDKVDGMDVRLEKVEQKVDRMQDDITEIKYTLSEKVNRAEFEKLEKRMIKVERAILSKRG
jgi:uncharacterized protein Yka (UPF0111/DUF47 family)